MHHFVVASSQPSAARIALCDSEGLFYVARALTPAPTVGTKLLGNGPSLGFGLLVGQSIDEVYRVTFEAVRCGPEALSAIGDAPEDFESQPDRERLPEWQV